jgi:multicomponent Na+:H+ antiporter subunit E
MKRVIQIPVRIVRFALFALFYFKELLVSSVLLARDILRSGHTFTHGIIAVDIDLKNDTSIITLANLLAMTPGSLTIDISPDKKRLYIHSMYLENPEKFKRKIKNSFEKAIKQIFE